MALIDHFQKVDKEKLDGRSVTEKWTYFETKLPSQTCGHRQCSELIYLLENAKICASFSGNTSRRKWDKRREKSSFSLILIVCMCEGWGS